MMLERFPDFYAPCGVVQSNLQHLAVNVGDLDHRTVLKEQDCMEKMALFYLEVTKLCTINLDELRRGMGVLTDYRGVGFTDVYPCLKFVRTLTELTAGPAHAVKLKKVSVLTPNLLSKFISLGVAVAPRKLQRRIKLGNTLEKFKNDLDMKQVPPHYGGSYALNAQEWIKLRIEEFEVSKTRIEIEFNKQVESLSS